ncbi:hypothetical protein INR49_027336 [Caranx melampygus]|nr:hypothetical protein INR49_027336 [Caranx melampygus]
MAVFKPENVEDFYEIDEVLGSGHFGQVRRVTERATGTCWAAKFLKIRKGACSRLGLERSSVEREVEILQAVQHPNIVTLKDVFESRAEVVLILELGGELFDFIAEKENLLEIEAIEFMKQILEGLGFMHSKNIAHFDLKPENIMLSDKVSPNPDVKLIDFGLAHRFHQGEEYRSTSGTPQYIAPEPITRKRNRSSINMKSFKKFNARRKWKMSYNMVLMCNRLVQLRLLCKGSSDPDLIQFSLQRFDHLHDQICDAPVMMSFPRDNVKATSKTLKANLPLCCVADSAAAHRADRMRIQIQLVPDVPQLSHVTEIGRSDRCPPDLLRFVEVETLLL